MILSLLAFGGFKGRAMVALAILLVAVADGVVDNGLKHLVNRPRPTQVQPVRVVDLQKANPRILAILKPPAVHSSIPDPELNGGRSFPSGHTVNNFAVAVAFIALFGRRGWLYLPVAAGIAYSRIYTGSHWPSDVMASVFIGLGVGLLGMMAAEAAWQRFGPRFAPATFAANRSLLHKGIAR